MFLLGFSFILGHKKPVRVILKRSIALFGLAYLLNLLKFVVPAIFGYLPEDFYSFHGIPHNVFGLIDLFMVGDILQFAAIAYLVCGILNRLQCGWIIAGAGSVIILCLSPLIWRLRSDVLLYDYLSKFFNGYPPAVFFPFFPWGAYPLAGLFFGQLARKIDERDFYSLLLKLGCGLALVGLIIQLFEPDYFNASFYRLGPGGTLMHLGIVLAWMWLCYTVANSLVVEPFIWLFRWYSIHITKVYMVQWVLVCWFLHLFGFHAINLFQTILAVMIISLLTFLIVFGVDYIQKEKARLLKRGV